MRAIADRSLAQLGSAPRIASPSPVALRLMTTLVSATTGAVRSSRQLRRAIRVASVNVGSVEDLAQLDAIEAQQPRELPFAQQFPALGFGGQQAEAKRDGTLCVTRVVIDGGRPAQNLTCLFVGDSAVGREPIPRTGPCEPELLEPPHDCLA